MEKKVVPVHFKDVDIHGKFKLILVLETLISEMLIKISLHNDQITVTQSNLTRFHSRAPPGISIPDYLKRIIQFASVEKSCLLILLIFIDRICEKHAHFTISSLTIHRFVITGITVGMDLY